MNWWFNLLMVEAFCIVSFVAVIVVKSKGA
jgi:hypothetical protein